MKEVRTSFIATSVAACPCISLQDNKLALSSSTYHFRSYLGAILLGKGQYKGQSEKLGQLVTSTLNKKLKHFLNPATCTGLYDDDGLSLTLLFSFIVVVVGSRSAVVGLTIAAFE